MFSLTSRVESGEIYDDDKVFKPEIDKAIFFKDTEDENDQAMQHENDYKGTVFKGNPFVKRENRGDSVLNISNYNDQKNEKFQSFATSNTDDSTTYVDSSEFGKKKNAHTSIKVNNSPNSVSSQRLAITRRQNILKSYFKSFKILTILTFLMFLCPLISVLLGITCVSTDFVCLPRLQIQTSGIVDQGSSASLPWFEWNAINKNKGMEQKEVQLIENFIGGLSSIVLTSPFDANLVSLKIKEVFQNEKSVIYKFSDFGYCKDIIGERKHETETICHLTFPYGLDIPSVIVKDLTFMLSVEEIDGDAEYVSDVFSKSCREVFKFMDFKAFGNIDLRFYSFMSSVMSGKIAYLSVIEYLLDVISLIMLIVVSISFKSKANRSLSTFKNFLFDSNFRRQYNEHTHRFLWIQMSLIVAVVVLWICTILKIVGVAYVLIYGVKLTSILREMDTNTIKGIKLFSSGMVLDVFNMTLHMIIAVSLTVFIIRKPWIINQIV